MSRHFLRILSTSTHGPEGKSLPSPPKPHPKRKASPSLLRSEALGSSTWPCLLNRAHSLRNSLPKDSLCSRQSGMHVSPCKRRAVLGCQRTEKLQSHTQNAEMLRMNSLPGTISITPSLAATSTSRGPMFTGTAKRSSLGRYFMVKTDNSRLVSKPVSSQGTLHGQCPPASLSNPREERPGTVGFPSLMLPETCKNPQTRLTWRKVVSQALMSLSFTSIWPRLLAPHWLILFPPLRSHLRSPMLPPSLSGIWQGKKKQRCLQNETQPLWGYSL